MDQRIYHGKISPHDFAQSLIAHFNRGNLRVQQVGSGQQVGVQIASRQGAESGGQTALGIMMQTVEDGVSVQVGKQAWLRLLRHTQSGWRAQLYCLRRPLGERTACCLPQMRVCRHLPHGALPKLRYAAALLKQEIISVNYSSTGRLTPGKTVQMNKFVQSGRSPGAGLINRQIAHRIVFPTINNIGHVGPLSAHFVCAGE